MNVEETRYSKPRWPQVREERRRDFRAGREQWVRMCWRSSVGRSSIFRRGEDRGFEVWEKGGTGPEVG